MIGQSSVKQALHVDVAISPRMAVALQLWTFMYENRAHWLNDEIRSLNLPAAIAGEIARAVIKTIAFPSISTGVYGYPKNRAAIIAVHAVESFLKSHNQIDKVIFVAYDEENYSIYEKLLK